MGDSQRFKEACLAIVLSPAYKERLYGARCCGIYAAKVSKEECECALDKRTQVKETWPGVGALVHAMEDEFPAVRAEGVRSIGKIADVYPVLKDKCVQVALEGLQDQSELVRLCVAKVALDCKPKVLHAPELRLVLETLTNDNSEKVKESLLDLLLLGPHFAEAKHAISTAEWLASLNLPLPYLYRFGQRHAEMISLSANALSDRIDDARIGTILAGALSIWGDVNYEIVRLAQIVETMARKMESRFQDFGKIPGWIKASLIAKKPVDELEGHRTALEFVNDCLRNAQNEDGRRKSLLRWTGFDTSSMQALDEWANKGAFPENEDLKFDDLSFLLSDEPFPITIDSEIKYQVDFVPEANTFGIARLRVHVVAFTYGQTGMFDLIVEHGSLFKGRHVLTILETGRVRTIFQPLSISIPLAGGIANLQPRFNVERSS